MKRRQPTRFDLGCAVLLMAASVVGCASLTDTNESIIRIHSGQDTGRASRLTLSGVKAMESGYLDHAAEKFLEAVKADETYGPAHNNLGLLHYERGNFYQAVLAFERAMELMPHDPVVFYNLGLTLQAAGKVHEALDLYWQAVEMEPTNPNFLGNLVRLRVQLGEDGPEVTTQLQDLALIETRPDWRRWADRQLALTFNDTLDRGPETPEFNSDRAERTETDSDVQDNVIDLTPTDPATSESEDDLRRGSHIRDRDDTRHADPNLIPSPEFHAARFESGRVEVQQLDPRPMPMRDEGSLHRLPPSIELVPASPDDFRD